MRKIKTLPSMKLPIPPDGIFASRDIIGVSTKKRGDKIPE